MTLPADRPRVIFDCNVIVQAIASKSGPSGQAIEYVYQSVVTAFVSRATLHELQQVLNYPDVRNKLPMLDDARIQGFMKNWMYRTTRWQSVPHLFDYPRAPQDEPYMDLAATVGAEFLVTNDGDLLALATDVSSIGKRFRQMCRGIQILKPVGFLQAIRARNNA